VVPLELLRVFTTMKPLLAILFLSSFLPCFAQRGRPAGTGSLGNVLHPGAPSPLPVYGVNRGGRRPSGYTPGYIGGYPLYVGGAYVPAYGTGYALDYSGQTQLNPQQQYAPAPPVVINQYFGPPAPAPEPVTGSGVYQPYSERQPQPEDDSAAAPSKYYLLAFKDHSVYSAIAYWVEDKTLHYVTPQNTHNQASLDLVDIDFTKQLNRDRPVPFTLNTPSGNSPAK
jgi:hypothetical protein